MVSVCDIQLKWICRGKISAWLECSALLHSECIFHNPLHNPPPHFSSTGLKNFFSNVVMYFLITFLVRVKLWGKWNHCYSSPTLLSSCVSEKQILRCSVNHFPFKMKCRFKDSLDLYRVQQILSILELKTTFYGLTNTFFYTMRITEQSWNSKI